MVRFCAKCGRLEGPETPIVDGLCLTCLVEERDLVKLPSEITVTMCSRCGSVKAGGRWHRPDMYDVEGFIADMITAEVMRRARALLEGVLVTVEVPRPLRPETYVKVKAVLRIGKVSASRDYLVKAEIKRGICPKCMSVALGKYEAIVQLRTTTPLGLERLNRLLNKVISSMDRPIVEELVEIEELKEGLDVKVSSYATARRIAKAFRDRLGALTKETFKDVGLTSNGRRRAKLTVVVRLPALLPGDVALYGDKLVRIVDVMSGRIVIERLADSVREVLPVDALWDSRLRPIPKGALSRDMILVTIMGDTACLFDPEDNKMYYLDSSLLPPKASEGDVVKTLIVSGRPYVLELASKPGKGGQHA